MQTFKYPFMQLIYLAMHISKTVYRRNLCAPSYSYEQFMLNLWETVLDMRHQDIMDIYIVGFYKTLLKLTFCGKNWFETENFNNSVDLQRHHEGTKMFGSCENDYNCKSERSASSIRGVVSVLDAFPISFFLKHIIPVLNLYNK